MSQWSSSIRSSPAASWARRNSNQALAVAGKRRVLGNSRGQPLLKHLINKREAALGGQPPRSFLGCYGELRSAQQVDGQRGGLRPGPASPTLMIIEGCQQELIMRIGRATISVPRSR